MNETLPDMTSNGMLLDVSGSLKNFFLKDTQGPVWLNELGSWIT